MFGRSEDGLTSLDVFELPLGLVSLLRQPAALQKQSDVSDQGPQSSVALGG